jgi:hypothetical protein
MFADFCSKVIMLFNFIKCKFSLAGLSDHGRGGGIQLNEMFLMFVSWVDYFTPQGRPCSNVCTLPILENSSTKIVRVGYILKGNLKLQLPY